MKQSKTHNKRETLDNPFNLAISFINPQATAPLEEGRCSHSSHSEKSEHANLLLLHTIRHMLTEPGYKSWKNTQNCHLKCPFCKERILKNEKKKHFNDKHPTKSYFPCPHTNCPFAALTQKSLDNHLATHKKQKIECPCGMYSSFYLYKIKRHQQTKKHKLAMWQMYQKNLQIYT